MEIKFEKNVHSTNGNTTQEMWISAYDFGANFSLKRITAFIHCGVKKVECEGYKVFANNSFIYQPLRELVTGMTIFIPEWVNEKRWFFITKLCQTAEAIEIDNLRVSEFLDWLRGEDIGVAKECSVILNGLNTKRSLNVLFEQDRI